MILYFTDRNLNILGLASTELDKGYTIIEDLLSEDIDTGINILTLRVTTNGEDSLQMQNMCEEGNYILKQSGSAFIDKENSYNSLFTIIETEYDTEQEVIYIYAEDAGLDLLNKVVAPATYSAKTLKQMATSIVPADWNVICGTTTTKTYVAENENTCTERLNSIANLFNYEVYYTFDVERLNVTAKNINLVKHRGDKEAKIQLRYDRDISNIVIKKSLSNMCTCLSVKGGTPENSKTPINLSGYEYSYTDPDTGDVYQVVNGQMRNVTAMKRWASKLDTDGKIVRQFTYDTTSKATLAGQARAQLQKWSKPEVNYEVTIINMPPQAKIGDRVYIVNDKEELYLDARILKLETSVTSDTVSATFGEYLIKESGIYEQVQMMAADFANRVHDGVDGVTVSVVSSGGNVFHNEPISTTLSATVFTGTNTITAQNDLEEMFGENAELRWYEGDTLLDTGFTYQVSSQLDNVSIVCRLYTEE